MLLPMAPAIPAKHGEDGSRVACESLLDLIRGELAQQDRLTPHGRNGLRLVGKIRERLTMECKAWRPN